MKGVRRSKLIETALITPTSMDKTRTKLTKRTLITPTSIQTKQDVTERIFLLKQLS